jgi:hypothetical protein
MIIFSAIVMLAHVSLSAPAAAMPPAIGDFDRGMPSPANMLERLKADAASMPSPAALPAAGQEDALAAPALPLGTKKELIRPFHEAFAAAIRRLRAPKCAEFYGANAEQQFRAVEYRYEDLGRPTMNAEGSVKVVGAQTVRGAPAAVFINSHGPFLNQSMAVQGTDKWRTLDLGTGLRGAEFGALLLLHELGHVVGKFGPDAQDSKLNRSYSEQVIQHCFR